MSDKKKRQRLIKDIIGSFDGSTQEEIRRYLQKQGLRASQSTLSRDLREIGAVKVPVDNGRSLYTLGNGGHVHYGLDDFGRAMAEFCVKYESIGNFMVIKTKSGNARDLCLILDRQGWKEIVGTLAGDDTILVIARTVSDIISLSEKLKK
ncbi:arginine repressor [Candidatus Latescibacterota bacterium]